MWNFKGPQIAKIIFKKSKARGFILPDFKVYYKAEVIKILCYWLKERNIDQNRETRIKSPQ